MSNVANVSPFELRIEILRHWGKPLYMLGAAVGVHPCTLSGMLRNRLPMPDDVKLRILTVLRAAQEARD